MERDLYRYLREVAKHIDGWEAVYRNLSAFLQEDGGGKIYIYPYQQGQQKRLRLEVSWHYEGEPLGPYMLLADREQNYTVTAKADTNPQKLARRLKGDLIPRYLKAFHRYRDEHFEWQERKERSRQKMQELAESVGEAASFDGFSKHLSVGRVAVRSLTTERIEFQVEVSNDRALKLLKTLEAIAP